MGAATPQSAAAVADAELRQRLANVEARCSAPTANPRKSGNKVCYNIFRWRVWVQSDAAML